MLRLLKRSAAGLTGGGARSSADGSAALSSLLPRNRAGGGGGGGGTRRRARPAVAAAGTEPTGGRGVSRCGSGEESEETGSRPLSHEGRGRSRLGERERVSGERLGGESRLCGATDDGRAGGGVSRRSGATEGRGRALTEGCSRSGAADGRGLSRLRGRSRRGVVERLLPSSGGVAGGGTRRGVRDLPRSLRGVSRLRGEPRLRSACKRAAAARTSLRCRCPKRGPRSAAERPAVGGGVPRRERADCPAEGSGRSPIQPLVGVTAKRRRSSPRSSRRLLASRDRRSEVPADDCRHQGMVLRTVPPAFFGAVMAQAERRRFTDAPLPS